MLFGIKHVNDRLLLKFEEEILRNHLSEANYNELLGEGGGGFRHTNQ